MFFSPPLNNRIVGSHAVKAMDKDFLVFRHILNGLHHCFDIIKRNLPAGTTRSQVLVLLKVLQDQSMDFSNGPNPKHVLMAVEEAKRVFQSR